MIRDAAIEDLGAIGALIVALAEYEDLAHDVEWDLELLGHTLFGPDAVPRTLVACDDGSGEVVGIAIWFRTYSTFQGRPGIWLEDLFVRPEQRGGGSRASPAPDAVRPGRRRARRVGGAGLERTVDPVLRVARRQARRGLDPLPLARRVAS